MITETQIEKFYEDLDALGLRFPNKEIVEKTGYSKGNVSEYLNRKKTPSEHFLNTFYEKFYPNSSMKVSRETDESHGIVSEPDLPTYIESRRKLKNSKTAPAMVPLVPVKAQAGYVRAYDQETYIDTLEKYALPPGVNPRGAVWRYWEVEGDSMEPAFHSGDIILTSQVHQFDWENLRNFYLYVIVTPEAVLFKRIFCKNDLEWVLISENEEAYEQQLLPVESVKEVWVFRRSIVSKAPPTKMFEIKV